MARKYLESCSKEQRRDILAELGITEESLNKDIEIIYSWQEKQPHLPKIRDDECLKSLIVRSKNSLEKVKRVVEMTYMWPARFPDIFSDLSSALNEFEILMKEGFLALPLPKLTPEGYRVLVFKIPRLTSQNVPSVQTLSRAAAIISILGIKEDFHKGIVIISDLKHLSVDMAAFGAQWINSPLLQFARSMPIRFHRVYIMNLNEKLHWLIDFSLNFLKDEKYRERIILGKTKTMDFSEVLPKNVLPSCFGGDEKSIAELRAEFIEFAKESRSILEANDIKADLTKIPKNYEFNSDVFEYSVNGSFRKLNLD